MLYSQTKPGQRVALMPSWGYRVGQNFYRNAANHLPGVITDNSRGAQWVYVKLDDGRTISTDSRALKSTEPES